MFLYSKWRNIPIDTRTKIAHQFGIIKKKPTHVSDNRIIEDGYLVEDIESTLTVDKLQEYTTSQETDMILLWNMMIDKIEGKTPIVEINTIFPVELPPVIEPTPEATVVPIQIITTPSGQGFPSSGVTKEPDGFIEGQLVISEDVSPLREVKLIEKKPKGRPKKKK